MIITETRKSIIQLIEPYMDKTLSEWCLVKTDIKNYKITKVIFHWFQITDYTWRQFEYILCVNWNKTKRISKWKILWHYDMTALLQFIYMKWIITHKLYNQSFDNANIHCEWYMMYGKPQFIFPNKPLHLYTESEDIELLKLLQYII